MALFALILDMDEKVYEQITNVARLPGIVNASYAMPDAHWGYGLPVGGVVAFEPHEGVISPGAVGYDIGCGVRLMRGTSSRNRRTVSSVITSYSIHYTKLYGDRLPRRRDVVSRVARPRVDRRARRAASVGQRRRIGGRRRAPLNGRVRERSHLGFERCRPRVSRSAERMSYNFV